MTIKPLHGFAEGFNPTRVQVDTHISADISPTRSITVAAMLQLYAEMIESTTNLSFDQFDMMVTGELTTIDIRKLFQDHEIGKYFSVPDLAGATIFLQDENGVPYQAFIELHLSAQHFGAANSGRNYYDDDIDKVDTSANGYSFLRVKLITRTELSSHLKAELLARFEPHKFIHEKTNDWFCCELMMLGNNGTLTFSNLVEVDQPLTPELYPFFDPAAIIDEFLNNSDEQLLILQGPPGTGKSTFIKHLANKLMGGNANKLALMFQPLSNDPSANIMQLIQMATQAKYSLIICEDADMYLKPREHDNATLAPLLTIIDGVIKLDRKWIFSTNLSDESKLDPAILRPGRCFDLIKFRALTQPEIQQAAKALKVSDDAHRALSKLKEATLAEIFEVLKHGELRATKRLAKKQSNLGRFE